MKNERLIKKCAVNGGATPTKKKIVGYKPLRSSIPRFVARHYDADATGEVPQALSGLIGIGALKGHVGFMPTLFAQGFVKPWRGVA